MTAVPAAPTLETRLPSDVYQAALAGARATMPEWALGFGPDPDYFDRADVGLVLFQLFGELFQKLSTPLNGVPGKYALAFWDFMGVILRAPTPAEAPVAFACQGSAPVVVDKATRVIGAGAPGVVFETAERLTVLPLTIAAAYAVWPAADAYADFAAQVAGGGAHFSLFADQASQQRFQHALYLGDDAFAVAGLTGQLTLTLEGANLLPRYFARWSNAVGEVLRPEVAASQYDTLTLTFADLPDLPAGEAGGITANWLVAAPAPDARIAGFLAGALPQIYSIAAKVALTAIEPDRTFFNTQSVDTKKGGRPFGTTPALQDAFYIACTAAFSRVEGQISLDFELQPITLAGPVTLAWEFWDGAAWQALDVTDGTANLTRSGQVTFECPQIEPTAINNISNDWIRARIAAGGYGQPAGVLVTEPAADVIDDIIGPYVTDKPAAIAALHQQGINFGYAYRPASYTPPFISSLNIECVTAKRPDEALTLNGFGYAPLESAPWMPPPETQPTFYLGLDARAFETSVAGRKLTLFFAPETAHADPQGSYGPPRPTLQLSYSSAGGWTPLTPVRRRTGNVSSEGVLEFDVPADFAPTSMFGRTLRWLRVEPGSNSALADQRFTGVYVNVTAAFNRVTQPSAILGSSTGAPDQSFLFPQKPILEGAVVQVYEPTPLAPGAPDESIDAEGPPAEGAVDAIQQAWVTWREVSNFDFSTPFSRHYVLDHTTGELGFGDGLRGAIPPKGTRNVRTRRYQSGGGAQGNLAAGTLNALQKAIPAISQVANVMPAVGGAAADQTSDLAGRAPAQVRSQGLAVTAADFASLAVEASQDAAQAVCVDAELGKLRLVVLPSYGGQTPSPSFDLLSVVGEYVRARCLPLLAPMVTVEGPDYVAIPAQISIIPATSATADTLQADITAAYAAFLDPLAGGPLGQGWQFGARVTAAAVAAMVQSVAGVQFVDGVSLGLDEPAVELSVDQLPTPGDIQIECVDADAL